MTDNGRILLSVTVYSGARKKPCWIGHRFTDEIVKALKVLAREDPSDEVRLRGAVVLAYLRRLTGVAQRGSTRLLNALVGYGCRSSTKYHLALR